MPKRSIPKRKGDPNRKPPERKVEVLAKVPMFEDLGTVVVPSNGRAKAFEKRFPCLGEVSMPSIRLKGVPEGAEITIVLSLNGEDIGSHKAFNLEKTIKGFPKFPVDEESVVQVWLERTGQESPVNVDADIAYLFQEKLRATVPIEVG